MNVSPGEPLRIQAEDWNALLAIRNQARAAARPSATQQESRFRPASLLIRLSNPGGTVLDAYGPLGIGSSLIDIAQNPGAVRETPCFAGAIPSATTPFAVRLEPLGTASGEVCLACVEGICVAKVSVTNTAHRYAEPTTSTSELASQAAEGRVRLLASPSSTGIQLLPVMVSQRLVVAGGGLTAVRRIDESVSLSNITRIGFGPSASWTISDPISPTGIANCTIEPATALISGLVSTGTQTMAGDKIFNNEVDVLEKLRVGVVSSNVVTVVEPSKTSIGDGTETLITEVRARSGGGGSEGVIRVSGDNIIFRSGQSTFIQGSLRVHTIVGVWDVDTGAYLQPNVTDGTYNIMGQQWTMRSGLLAKVTGTSTAGFTGTL